MGSFVANDRVVYDRALHSAVLVSSNHTTLGISIMALARLVGGGSDNERVNTMGTVARVLGAALNHLASGNLLARWHDQDPQESNLILGEIADRSAASLALAAAEVHRHEHIVARTRFPTG